MKANGLHEAAAGDRIFAVGGGCQKCHTQALPTCCWQQAGEQAKRWEDEEERERREPIKVWCAGGGGGGMFCMAVAHPNPVPFTPCHVAHAGMSLERSRWAA